MSDRIGGIGRRQFVGGAGVTALGSTLAGLLGIRRVAHAQSLTGPVPEVDRLAVRVVTDSYHHAFEPTRRVGEVEVQRFAFALSKAPPRRARRRLRAPGSRARYWAGLSLLKMSLTARHAPGPDHRRQSRNAFRGARSAPVHRRTAGRPPLLPAAPRLTSRTTPRRQSLSRQTTRGEATRCRP